MEHNQGGHYFPVCPFCKCPHDRLEPCLVADKAIEKMTALVSSCPSCAALRASCSAKDARIRELEEEQEVSKKRILSLIHERDGYKIRAEQRFALREEVEELLGVKGTYDEEQFEKGLKELRKLVKLRNP